MDNKVTIQPAPPCADLVCTNTFTGCAVITLPPTLTPAPGILPTSAIIENNVACNQEFITCTATIDSGCGIVEGEVTLAGFTLSGSIFYVADFAVVDACGNQAFLATRRNVSIPANTLVCTVSVESPLTCADFNTCPTVTTTVTAVDCPGLGSNVFEIVTTFTFACPVI
jgi:hypothetical protein